MPHAHRHATRISESTPTWAACRATAFKPPPGLSVTCELHYVRVGECSIVLQRRNLDVQGSKVPGCGLRNLSSNTWTVRTRTAPACWKQGVAGFRVIRRQWRRSHDRCSVAVWPAVDEVGLREQASVRRVQLATPRIQGIHNIVLSRWIHVVMCRISRRALCCIVPAVDDRCDSGRRLIPTNINVEDFIRLHAYSWAICPAMRLGCNTQRHYHRTS